MELDELVEDNITAAVEDPGPYAPRAHIPPGLLSIGNTDSMKRSPAPAQRAELYAVVRNAIRFIPNFLHLYTRYIMTLGHSLLPLIER